MSCLTKIQQSYHGLITSQKRIADYILENPGEVVNMNVKDLGNLTNTSPASIVRFSRKIGFDGFPSLKLELAHDIFYNKYKDFSEDEPNLDGSFIELLAQENKAYINTIKKVFELLNPITLEEVIRVISKSKNIHLVGFGSSAIICEDLLSKLTRIHFNAYYHSDIANQIASTTHLTNKDVLIMISYEGKEKYLSSIAKEAKKNKVPIIAITQNNGNELVANASYVLPVLVEEHLVRKVSITSRVSSFILCDLIYLGLIRLNKDKSIQYLESIINHLSSNTF